MQLSRGSSVHQAAALGPYLTRHPLPELDGLCMSCMAHAGKEYEKRLRQLHKRMHPRTSWARRRQDGEDAGRGDDAHDRCEDFSSSGNKAVLCLVA